MSVCTKICGLSTEETVSSAVRNGADYIGFVFFEKSPRAVSPEKAAMLIRQIPDHIRKIGVFVDPDNSLLERALASGLTGFQLHGHETAERIASIRETFPKVTIWKALSIASSQDLTQAPHYRGLADRLLYDARTDGVLPGGMGRRFDWRLLKNYKHPLPWALSGGLDAGNIAQAVAITGAELVDISSGVETSPGIKDMDKIAQFLQAVRLL
ncbi:phosphoribosylanthranilate isomerase [Zymomonas mobilis]|uniref:N-(5'-phosphoribosyl)anthranilate isomerase n=1 Tax=Zymomonas mobilis TaxID=542 RepID=A0A542W0H3_ZYMMB|nr:phosphoribosylanthranilate isomerase [Zymomonas mobilis]TQL17057.1 phosphoribosylanthranilate isomerase [Zymomonas mobilis]